jgi:hypothetical protein
MILNASATPPFVMPASNLADFYLKLMSEKFKAEEALLHRLTLEKILRNYQSRNFTYPEHSWTWYG